MAIVYIDMGLFCFWVGNQSYYWLFVIGYWVYGSWYRVDSFGYVGKHGLDALFHAVNIYISHNDDGLLVGAIPFVVVGSQCVIFEVVDDGGVAYDIAFGIL